jgi:phage-related protein
MKWQGTDITTKGLIALTQPERVIARKKVDIDPIDGSDKTQVTERGYEPYETSVQFYCSDPDTYLDGATVFLQGTGALISDDDANKYINARIFDEVRFKRVGRGHKGKVAEVNFYVADPFMYKVGETATTLTSSGNVTNAGTVNSLPLLKITGTGTVVMTIGGRSFTYVFGAEPYVYIDSDSLDAYYLTTKKNANMTGAFPYLTPGVNAVSWTGTVTELVITPRSRYL